MNFRTMKESISRRNFLYKLATFLGGFFLLKAKQLTSATFPQFFIAQLQYRGGHWDPNPQFVEPIIEELELRTSIDAFKERKIISLSDPFLFFCPFIYMAGRYEFDPFSHQEREILRKYLTFGGFLFAEDTLGVTGFGFDKAFRREMTEIFQNKKLKTLHIDHSVYRSFYLIENVAGRQRINPYLEGIDIGGWTPVIYSQNDLSGAWARDRYGRWVNECYPGGEKQRLLAFKTGINIIVYSLCSDYKKDLIHHPFIQKRQNL